MLKQREIERQYRIRHVAKDASCEPDWIRQLIEKYDLKIKRNRRNHYVFTQRQKDDLVRLRWLHSDYQKCVKYCFENKILIP